MAKRGRPVKATKELFLRAIEGSRGNAKYVAERLGVERPIVYQYFKRWPDCKPKFDEERELMIDEAENKLRLLIENDKIPKVQIRAIEFLLRTVGKGRGYTEKQEIEHTGDIGGNVTINILDVDARTMPQNPELASPVGAKVIQAAGVAVLPEKKNESLPLELEVQP